MTKIAMGTWTFIFPPYEDKPQDFDSILDRAAEIGFDGVEVGWFAPHPEVGDLQTPESRAAYKRGLDERGLGLAGVVANFDGCPSVVTNDNNSGFLATLDSQLDLCADLGIGLLRLDIADPPDVITTVDPERAHERVVGTWTAAAEHGAERGVRVGWEFEPGTPFNKPSEILRIVNDVTHPNWGVIYDTTQAHNVANGANQVGEVEVLGRGQIELIEGLKGRITHLHLIDGDDSPLWDGRFSRHIPFGQGHVDWETVMPALVEAGTGDEWWTIDVCWWDNAWPVFEDGLDFVRGLRDRYAS